MRSDLNSLKDGACASYSTSLEMWNAAAARGLPGVMDLLRYVDWLEYDGVTDLVREISEMPAIIATVNEKVAPLLREWLGNSANHANSRCIAIDSLVELGMSEPLMAFLEETWDKTDWSDEENLGLAIACLEGLVNLEATQCRNRLQQLLNLAYKQPSPVREFIFAVDSLTAQALGLTAPDKITVPVRVKVDAVI